MKKKVKAESGNVTTETFTFGTAEKYSQIKFHSAPEGYVHVHQLFTIILPNQKIRDKMIQFLATKGIMSKIFFVAIHETKFYKNLK